MTRHEAAQFARDELNKHGLADWSIRLTATTQGPVGKCIPKDKCIILNAHHVDTHPDEEIKDTILHEIAHALTPGHGHDADWRDRAIEIGCKNLGLCPALSEQAIDAIRSGAELEVTFEEEVIRKPKYTVTRLQDKCAVCGKVAKSVREVLVESVDPLKPDEKFIFLECGHLEVKKIPKGTPFQTLVSNSEYVKNCKHEFNGNKCIHCGEYRPYEFQVEGMRAMESALAVNKGFLIADEMGLGKTIQVLGYLKFHPEMFPVLFIVKSGIKYQLFKEILRWLGDSYMAQIISSSSDYLIPQLKTYIVSYDMLVPKVRTSKKGKTITQGFDITKFQTLGIKTIVLDECQQIKNPDSSRTQQVRKIAKNTNVIGLSGTPWKNRGSEFFSILNMIAPTKFWSYQGFLDRWVDYYYQGAYRKMGGIHDIKAFKEYTKDLLIRRERREVMKELPEITRNLQYTELDSLQQGAYDEELSDFVKWYNSIVLGGEEDTIYQPGSNNIIAKLSRMRHIAGLAKIPATEAFVDEFVEDTDRKLVIFVHHKDVGEILFNKIKKAHGEEIEVFKLTADLSSEERFHLQEKFNSLPRAIMIASTLASGEGLNLQTCADCIIHERQWNPQNEEQAEGRFIRIGQQSEIVSSTYITAANTVDEHLANIVERKRAFFHAAMNKGEMPKWNQTDIVKEVVQKLVSDYNKKNKVSLTKMASL
jgi:superfamily II DNA or RNA helicase